MKRTGVLTYECDPESLEVNMHGDSDSRDYQSFCLDMFRGKQKLELIVEEEDGNQKMTVKLSDGTVYRLILDN